MKMIVMIMGIVVEMKIVEKMTRGESGGSEVGNLRIRGGLLDWSPAFR